MRISDNSKTLPLSFFLVVCVLFICVAIFTNGSADSGDSIAHYTISRFSWKHPILFLDLWNKPLFCLLSSPFAQFGFTGIKIFNALCGCLSALMAFRIATIYSKSNNWLVLVLFVSSAFHLVVQNSGLTEPLFDCLLIGGLFLYIHEKKIEYYEKIAKRFSNKSVLEKCASQNPSFQLFFVEMNTKIV